MPSAATMGSACVDLPAPLGPAKMMTRGGWNWATTSEFQDAEFETGTDISMFFSRHHSAGIACFA